MGLEKFTTDADSNKWSATAEYGDHSEEFTIPFGSTSYDMRMSFKHENTDEGYVSTITKSINNLGVDVDSKQDLTKDVVTSAAETLMEQIDEEYGLVEVSSIRVIEKSIVRWS